MLFARVLAGGKPVKFLSRRERPEESLGKTEMLRGFAAQHDINRSYPELT